MHRILRDTIDLIRAAGRTDIIHRQRSRHTEVAFNANGRPARVLVHKGAETQHYEMPRLRSQVRRAMEGR
ncbi:hypothetical protein PQJ75_00965 [Rhodoplanes sp. TEM]|uniref:Uncharacterized protein n=1 Tax=Rhodoplanes tepidamans TaxID=200616 RepID=A0ABT5J5A6_RHOTP|nr:MULTISPECIES: hypothetical protein [Rhodoplanes]MDC7784824.1 hypothetical protein [Rhodoplanes tepidamans]MDC7982291.1 hypothetical protein [Rhodoplanes sp. TEM]MDQ0356299.1 hypothetical protein [Rhodoplanes tepidamans]